VIDRPVIDNEENYGGYCAAVANLDGGAKAMLAINRERYKIEDYFRAIKANFKSRPACHRDRKRVIAHFMVCYTALLIYRLLWPGAGQETLPAEEPQQNNQENFRTMAPYNIFFGTRCGETLPLQGFLCCHYF
jgi:hypothetical protein